MANSSPKRKLVDSPIILEATLHNPRPLEQHIYTTPSVIFYAIWSYVYFYQYERFLGSREFTVLSCLLCGACHALTYLICQWSVDMKAYFTCYNETDPYKATVIRIQPTVHNGVGAFCPLLKTKIEKKSHLYFFFQKLKYVYNDDTKLFEKLHYHGMKNTTFEDFKKQRGLKSTYDINTAMEKYGENKFDIPIPLFLDLFKEHLQAPFFVFQLFCVALWFLDEMWMFSLFTLLMLFVFESTVVFQRLKSLQEFRSMSIKPYPINVYRNGIWSLLQTNDLIPGDVVSVTRQKEEDPVPCDMVILEGACIANEAMLSGESTPQLKESVALRENHLTYDINEDKNHTLFGGTRVLQVTPPEKNSTLNTPDGGCLAYVLRTGFATQQGKLVRTIIYSTERITANNLESLLFILFLLIFAIGASWYVWTESSKMEGRKKSKVLLDCILIITSVVPPELPMELSLAVNNSILALSKNYIYCTEPFRIPFAGKIDIACFDKTGTLTEEDLLVEGVTGLQGDAAEIQKCTDLPIESVLTLATAHALVRLEEGVVGDPMEKNTLESIHWEMQSNDTVVPAKVDGQKHTGNIKILRRFPFSSALKRMSSVAQVNINGSSKLFIATKGAPETLKEMYSNVPDNYDSMYKSWAKKGSRVLAFGYKYLDANVKQSDIKDLARAKVESGLIFAGFLIFHCPLKPDAVDAVKMLSNSSHRVVMITGDNALTACHVAGQTGIIRREVVVGDVRDNDAFTWKSIDEKTEFTIDLDDPKLDARINQYDLCITGRGLTAVQTKRVFAALLPRLWVYARVSPSQKEFILTEMKAAGYTTMMVGDGTNDVGALKQAHVGIALLDGKQEDIEKMAERNKIRYQLEMQKRNEDMKKSWGIKDPVEMAAGKGQEAVDKQSQLQKQLDAVLAEMDDPTLAPTIKFGDASVAAPFTSKLGSVMSVVNVVRQGRATLVAMVQMYKILALNCLISAYSMSVLYLAGIKQGDYQATIAGMMITVCFFAIARSNAVEGLSKKRPQANIFNLYIILSVLGQVAVHVTSLIYIRQLAIKHSLELHEKINLDSEFKPNLLNSAVYLVNLIMQISTFAINYQGRPFRESLVENKALYQALMSVTCVAFTAASELVPELNNWMQLVQFPGYFRYQLLGTMVFDFGGAWLVEMTTLYLFSDNRPNKSLMLE